MTRDVLPNLTAEAWNGAADAAVGKEDDGLWSVSTTGASPARRPFFSPLIDQLESTT